MAIKGKAYTKTSWAFEERPVASSKLNLWDDRIEDALELAFFLIAQAWGGGDGVLRALESELEVVETDPVGLSVDVLPGFAFIGGHVYRLQQTTQTADVTPPVTNPRIDIVQARLGTWDVNTKQGTEAASPVAPAADADTIVLAQLYLRPGMTSIQNTDDTINGYIIDTRNFV